MEQHHRPATAGAAPGTSSQVQFGVYAFDPVRARLWRDGRPVRLRPQAAALLARLVVHAGEVVSRDELRIAVWGPSTHVEHEVGLNSLVRHLRRALRDDADNPRFIRTVPRVGYAFIAPLRSTGDGTDTATPRPAPASMAARPRRPTWYLVAAALAVAAAAVTVAVAPWPRGPQGGRRLGVLPVEVTGDGERLQYLALALTEGLTRELSRVDPGRLEIVAHPTRGGGVADAYLGDVGQRLGLDLVLLGGVVPSGGGAHVSFQVLRPGTRAVVWTYSADLAFDEGGEIAREVAAELAARLGLQASTPVSPLPTAGPEARDAYLRSLCFEARPGLESWHEATRWLDRAVALEPANPDALTRRAQLLLAHPSGAMHRTLARRADRDAAAALALDPGASLPLAIRARTARCLGRRDVVELARAAVARQPASAGCRLVLAAALQANGQPEAAIAEIRHASDLDPLRIFSADTVGWLHLTAGRAPMAVDHLLRAEALDPGRRFPLGFYLALIEALEETGRIEEAAQACRRCAERHGIALDGAAWAAHTPAERVAAFWEWMAGWSGFQFERFPDTTIGPQFTIRPLLRLGRYQEAAEAIRRADRAGYCDPLLASDPIYAPVRDLVGQPGPSSMAPGG